MPSSLHGLPIPPARQDVARRSPVSQLVETDPGGAALPGRDSELGRHESAGGGEDQVGRRLPANMGRQALAEPGWVVEDH
eukprot:5528485-Pyramimonas_sp.AAC.1